MALARRNVLPALDEPLYEMCDVPRWSASAESGVSNLIRVTCREAWLKCLAELVLLCSEASERFRMRSTGGKEHGSKPLSLEYLADRLDLDDPLYGYVLRTKAEGWLQGFVTVTTFTTWQTWFRWDSLCEEADVLPWDGVVHNWKVKDEEHAAGESGASSHHFDTEWWMNRKVDCHGHLARALEAEIREGDPETEGVIWPHVAEVSLLGGLGCGGWLLSMVLDELEQPESPYEFVVLQATENSVPFYEKHGFVRVGAVARYRDNERGKKKTSDDNDSSYSSCSRDESNSGDGEDSNDDQEKEKGDHPGLKGVSSKFFWHTTKRDKETVRDVAKQHGVLASDIVFLNRRIHSELKEGSGLYVGTRLRVPVYSEFYERRGSAPRMSEYSSCSVRQARKSVAADGAPGSTSSNGLWYTAKEDETGKKIARQLGVSLTDLCSANVERYPAMNGNSAFKSGSVFRIPGKCPDVDDGKMHDAADRVASWYTHGDPAVRSKEGWGIDIPQDDNADDTDSLSKVITYPLMR